MNDDELYKIATKSFENVESRKRFNELYENLQRNFIDFRK